MGPRRDAFFTELPFATDQCERNLWASFALVHNLLPMGGCFSITWSLAVQMQFYACFPVLLVLLRPSAPGFRHAPVCGNMLPSTPIEWCSCCSSLRYALTFPVTTILPC